MLQEGNLIFLALIPLAFFAPSLLAGVFGGLAVFRLLQAAHRFFAPRAQVALGFWVGMYFFVLIWTSGHYFLSGSRHWNDQFLFLAIGGLLLADTILVLTTNSWKAAGLLARETLRPPQFSLGLLLFGVLALGFFIALFLALFRPGGLYYIPIPNPK